jgi:hypothetical protein
MEEDKNAIKTEETVATPTVDEGSTTTQEDAEARIAVLEAERNKAIEEAANYKLGMLKAKGKIKEDFDDEETEDERIERIVQEKLSATKIAQIDTEKEVLLKKLAKENKELKLAFSNKTSVATSVGSHSESRSVTDTSVTPEQLAAFKSRGWSEKDIENYKKNLRKYGGR